MRFICLLLLLCRLAQANPEFKIFKTTPQGDSPVSSIQIQSEIKTFPATKDWSTHGIVSKLAFPSNIRLKQITSELEFFKVKIDQNKAVIASRSLNFVITVETIDGKKFTLRLKSEEKEYEPKIVNCYEEGLVFEFKPEKPKFLSFIECRKTGQNLDFLLTVPEEVKITESSQFEKLGKGESWKLYGLGNVGAAKGDLVKMKFNYGGFPVELVLRTRNLDIGQQSFSEGYLITQFGLSQLSIKSNDVTVSDIKPILGMESFPYGLLSFFKIGFKGEFVINVGQNNKSINSTKIFPRAYLQFVNSESLDMYAITEVAILSQKHLTSNFGYDITQVGAGLGITYTSSKQSPWRHDFEVRKIGFSSQVIQNFIVVDYSILKRRKEGYAWGLKLRMDTSKIVVAEKQTADFSMTSLLGQYAF